MSKIAVIYWSGTGNTTAMAEAVVEGAKGAGADVDLFQVSEITVDAALAYDALALGCPAMGSEELEESEFEPFFADLEGKLNGKKVALFGSYSWADGEWMRTWYDRTAATGAVMAQAEGLAAYDAPDDAAIADCKALGVALAG